MESYIHDKNEGLDCSQVSMIRATAERLDSFIFFFFFLYCIVLFRINNAYYAAPTLKCVTFNSFEKLLLPYDYPLALSCSIVHNKPV